MQRFIASCVSTAVLLGSGGLYSPVAFSQDGDRDIYGDRGRAHWSSWGGNPENTRSSFTERRISRENVSHLHTKWVFATAGDVSATPTVEGNDVYAVDWGGGVYRIDAKTGKAVWSKSMQKITGNSMSFSRTSPAIAGDKIIIGDQGSGSIFALDRATGDVAWQKVVDTLPAAYITNSPVVSDGIVYVGVSSGEEGLGATDPTYVFKFRASIQALDVQTGAVIWKTHIVPKGYTGGAIWGSNFIIDHARNALVATTGNNYTVPAAVSTCLKAAKTGPEKLACLSPEDYIDAVISLNLSNGAVRWANRLEGADTWHEGCVIAGGVPCPDPAGPDYDLGAGANLITVRHDRDEFWDGDNDRSTQIIGAGQKSGVYWGLNPDTGKVIYATQVGPGGNYGGIEWGTATDNRRVYVPTENFYHYRYTLPTTGETWTGGTWAGLNAETGKVIWETKVPGKDPHHPAEPSGALAPVSEANGIVYGGSMSGYFVAMDSRNGKILWQYQSGGSVNCGPAIVNGVVYWGSGYANDPKRLGGKGNNKLFAFTVDEDGDGDR